MYHHLESISCPECRRALQEFVSPEQVRTKRRFMLAWLSATCLLTIALAFVIAMMIPPHSGRELGRLILGSITIAIAGLFCIWRYHRWDNRWLPQRGTLLVETDGEPHVHLGGFPDLQDRVGPLVVTVFRSFLAVEPFLIYFDMIHGGKGHIMTFRQSKIETVGYQWESLEAQDWQVTVKDPFERIEFANNRESLTWKSEYKRLSLIGTIRFVSAWPSVAEFVAHVTQGSNTIEAPLGRLAELEHGLVSLEGKIEACEPRPIHGGRLLQFVRTLRGDETAMLDHPTRLEEDRLDMIDGILNAGLGNHDLGVDPSNRPKPEVTTS